MISVVIPIYNSENTYLKSISSVLNQDFNATKIEIIIVDDCSTNKAYLEDLLALLNSKNVNFKLIEHETNLGVGSARNTGILNSTGEFIALLDSDDEWHSNKLSKQYKLMRKNKDVIMVGALTNMPESRLPFFSNSNSDVVDVPITKQVFKNYFQPSTVLIRKSVFENFEWPKRRFAEEGDVFLRLYQYGKLYLINEILVNYSNGKKGFGISGLSSKIFLTQKEEIKNINGTYKRSQIGFIFYLLAITFSYIKYFRRIIITIISKNGRF